MPYEQTKQKMLMHPKNLIRQAELLSQLSEGKDLGIEDLRLIFREIAKCFAENQVGLYALASEDPLHSGQLSKNDLTDEIILTNINRAKQIPLREYYQLIISHYNQAIEAIGSLIMQRDLDLSPEERMELKENRSTAINACFDYYHQKYLTPARHLL